MFVFFSHRTITFAAAMRKSNICTTFTGSRHITAFVFYYSYSLASHYKAAFYEYGKGEAKMPRHGATAT